MYIITFLRTNPFYKIQLISAKKNTLNSLRGQAPNVKLTLLVMEILTWESYN